MTWLGSGSLGTEPDPGMLVRRFVEGVLSDTTGKHGREAGYSKGRSQAKPDAKDMSVYQ